MKSFEEICSAGIGAARAALAQAAGKERIAAAFAEWWGDRDDGKQTASGQSGVHPSAERLAEELRVAGMGEAASFAVDQWVKEGPIDPGVWLVAILLGESFVEPFVGALMAGEWRTPRFFGLETWGAWNAFDTSLRDRLRTAADASEAALKRLRLSVENVKKDPIGSMYVHGFSRGNLEERIKQYSVSPDVDEVGEHPYDPPVWMGDYFLWDVLLEVRPAETLVLLGEFPHPIFMRNCFGSKRLTQRVEEVGGLIRMAPDAFNDDGVFQAGGAVAVLSLEIAGAAITKGALDSDGSFCVVPMDKSELLAPAIGLCQSATKTIVDALFSRRDAVPLAWAWLERIVLNGKLRGRWSTSDGGLAINLPLLVIIALAERLNWRLDWKEWVGERQKLWRIYRLVTVLAVGTFGEAPDRARLASALEQTLLECDLDYAGIENTVADAQDVVAAIGGCAISRFHGPADWVAATWRKLRPVREQNWRVGVGGERRNNMGALLVLWGFAAHRFLPLAERKALWISLEKTIRDAWQTDVLGYAPVWSRALVRLFSMYESDNSNRGASAEQQLAQTLLPYIAADNGFLILVCSLMDQGWPFEVIREAVAIAGFDLGRLVNEFLDMKRLVLELPQANTDEIRRIRKLAETAARTGASGKDSA